MVRPPVPDVCHTPVFRQCLKAAGHWDTACSPRLAAPSSHSALNREQVIICAVAAEQVAINAALKIPNESLCIAASQSPHTFEAVGILHAQARPVVSLIEQVGALHLLLGLLPECPQPVGFGLVGIVGCRRRHQLRAFLAEVRD